MKLCVVLPVYNEEENIEYFIEDLTRELEKTGFCYFICAVDDGSSDNSVSKLRGLKNGHIRIIEFSRNFGKDAAILAGLENSEADIYVVMDADGQHRPHLIHDMIALYREGYSVVNGVKQNYRARGMLSRFMSKAFNYIFERLSGMSLMNSSDYKLLDKKAAKAVTQCNDSSYFFRAMTKWVGFRQTDILFNVKDRQEGTSGWTYRKLVIYALNAILLYSYIPLYVLLLMGFGSFMFGAILGVKLLVDYFFYSVPSGYATLLALSLLSFSIIVICIGILGLYLQKVLDQVKGRPRYITRDFFKRNQ